MDHGLYENLPQDPEEAFLLLERHFRFDCEEQVRNAGRDDNTHVFYVDYIAQVLAAISELGLSPEFDNRVPKIEDIDYTTYLNFSKDVKHYRTMLEIRHGRRAQGHSVRFDLVTKEKVRHHLNQLRTIFEKLEVDQNKKEDLFSKLDDLQNEVDRDRTRYDAFAALAIETAGVVGEMVEKSRLLKILDGIASVFWRARADETKRLPAPTTPKRIEPPRAPKSAPMPENRKVDLDDEMPF